LHLNLIRVICRRFLLFFLSFISGDIPPHWFLAKNDACCNGTRTSSMFLSSVCLSVRPSVRTSFPLSTYCGQIPFMYDGILWLKNAHANYLKTFAYECSQFLNLWFLHRFSFYRCFGWSSTSFFLSCSITVREILSNNKMEEFSFEMFYGS
jgi:hypothetical protein